MPRWKILVADDEESTRSLYCLVLARAGYDVEAASDGEQAWTALQQVSYDLLLTDHHMPHLTGLRLVARMRAAGMLLPVIINSGSLDLDLTEGPHLPDLEVAAVFHKPFDFTDIVEAVKGILPVAPDATPGTIRKAPSAVTNVVPLPVVKLVTQLAARRPE